MTTMKTNSCRTAPNKRRQTSQGVYQEPEEQQLEQMRQGSDEYDVEAEFRCPSDLSLEPYPLESLPSISTTDDILMRLLHTEDEYELISQSTKKRHATCQSIGECTGVGSDGMGELDIQHIELDTGRSDRTSVVELCKSGRTREAKRLLIEILDAPLHEIGELTLISRLDWSLPLKAITKVVKKAQLLTSLSFFSLAFQGHKRDFEAFVESLRTHPTLREIHFVDCNLVDQTIPIDSLLSALAQIPTLETVEIYAMDLEREASVSLMSPSALADLCKSPSIVSLSLQDLDLDDEHVREIASALETNERMKSITLWDCNVTDKGGQMLASMLEVNTTLEKVDLSYNDLRDAAFKSFAGAICKNSTMWSLSLHENTHIVREDIGAGSGYEAIIESLKDHNQVIEEMILESEADPRVSFYQMVNRNRHLLEADDVKRSQLVDCLSKHEDHLSFFYYLLRTNPDLCDVDR